jgi:N utilization substance protein A
MKAYIVEVRKTAKGPQIVVSRTHPGLVRRLFELEVPELVDGVVEIRAVAREPGHRTKLAVASNDQNVDPVGACVGARGMRVRQVVNELRGEKVDIVPFSSDGPEFVMRALAPAKVREVRLHEDTGIAEVIVPDFQLSLAIGKEGQNARLAARLTGWRVDIKSESQLAEEESGGGYAEGEWVEGPDGGLMWQPAEGGEAISAAEAGYATLGEGAPTEGATGDGAPPEGTTSDGSPDSPDAGEQVAVAPEETAMHVEASVADEAADEIAADADLGTADADIRTEANQEIEETATPETVEES